MYVLETINEQKDKATEIEQEQIFVFAKEPKIPELNEIQQMFKKYVGDLYFQYQNLYMEASDEYQAKTMKLKMEFKVIRRVIDRKI